MSDNATSNTNTRTTARSMAGPNVRNNEPRALTSADGRSVIHLDTLKTLRHEQTELRLLRQTPGYGGLSQERIDFLGLVFSATKPKPTTYEDALTDKLLPFECMQEMVRARYQSFKTSHKPPKKAHVLPPMSSGNLRLLEPSAAVLEFLRLPPVEPPREWCTPPCLVLEEVRCQGCNEKFPHRSALWSHQKTNEECLQHLPRLNVRGRVITRTKRRNHNQNHSLARSAADRISSDTTSTGIRGRVMNASSMFRRLTKKIEYRETSRTPHSESDARKLKNCEWKKRRESDHRKSVDSGPDRSRGPCISMRTYGEPAQTGSGRLFITPTPEPAAESERASKDSSAGIKREPAENDSGGLFITASFEPPSETGTAPNAATEAKDTHDQGTDVITDNAMIIPSGIDAVNALIEFNKQPKQPEPTPRPKFGRSIFLTKVQNEEAQAKRLALDAANRENHAKKRRLLEAAVEEYNADVAKQSKTD